MLIDKREILFPATVYRPTAVAILMEDSDILENRTNIVEFPNYSLDMKVTRHNIFKPIKNPFGYVEIKHGVVLELTDSGQIVEHVIGNVDRTPEDGLLGEEYVLDNLQGSFVSANRFIALRVASSRDMKIAGVYLVLDNDVRAWANGILESSPVNLVKYSKGIVFEEPYKKLTTDDMRLGIKSDFVSCFKMIAAVKADPYKTSEQKKEEEEFILKQAEGDVIHFTDRGQYVVFTFGIPITKRPSTLVTYSLDYFMDGSVDPNSIDTSYWFDDKEVRYPDGSKKIAKPFWEGRNELLTQVGFTQSVIDITDFHKFYWRFLQDRNQGKIFIKSLLDGWVEFKTGAKKYGLTDEQLASIYMGFYLGVPVNVFPPCKDITSNNVINTFVRYIGRCHTFTLEWVDFNDVDPDPSTGGFSYDYPYDTNFLNFLNIEESAFSLTELPASLCSAFQPHGWRFLSYPDPFAVIKPEEDMPSEEPMYKGYKVREIIRRTNLTPFILCEVIIHEIGHAVDAYGINAYKQRFTDMDEWLEIAGWSRQDGYDPTVAKIPKNGYSNTLEDGREVPVSSYGCTDRREDFAETYRMYIINPAFLRDNFPRRYSFMEKYIKTLKPVEEARNCAIRDYCTKRKLWVCR